MTENTQVIGEKYSIVKKINQGGMAEVFQAKDPGGKIWAVKFILPEYSTNQHFIKMLIEEAKNTAVLKHPNILRISSLGLDKASSRYYVVMEYIDGKNLWEVIARLIKQKKRFPQETALLIMQRILSGLYFAHTLKTYYNEGVNLVHLDVNPPNIMVSFDGKVKVADFGIARARSLSYKKSEQKLEGLRGKFSYMSPEQAAGDAVDHQTDLYACGIMLWEMLTLTKCFQYKDPKEAIELIKKGEIVPPRRLNPDIPPRLEHIVLKALQRNKSKRYQNCQDFNYDLIRYHETAYPHRVHNNIKQFMATLWPDGSHLCAGVKPLPLDDETIKDKRTLMEKTPLFRKLFGW